MDWPKKYVEAGLSTIPVKPRDKKPLVPWQKYQKEPPSPQEINNWFNGKENNIGIVCGEVSGNLLVIDFDDPTIWEKLKENTVFKSAPRILTSRKPNERGVHVWLRTTYKPKTERIFTKHDKHIIDIQGEGTYVLAPPSTHPDGIKYEFSGDLGKIPLVDFDVNQWLKDRLEEIGIEVKKTQTSVASLIAGVSKGARNEAAIRLATYLRKNSKSENEVIALLSKWNEKNVPPLDPMELERTIKSAYSMEKPYGYYFKENPKQTEIASDLVIEVKKHITPSFHKSPLTCRKLIFSTEHLPYFKQVDRVTQLYSDKYLILKKALWYMLFSIPFRKCIIQLGSIITDGRVSVAFPMPSGSGKKNLIYVLEVLTKMLNLSFAKPASYHPEALVGKTIRKGRKNPDFEEIKGPLSEDVVILNECIELIRGTGDADKETRVYINTAADPYPQNEIIKRMTDLPKEHALRYKPCCILGLFFQPMHVREEVALVGTLRRFLVPFVKGIKDEMDVINYFRRVDGLENLPISHIFIQLKEKLEKLQRVAEKGFTFTPEAKERFKELHFELIKQGFSHSVKGKNYTHICDYTLQDQLAKLACIQAGARERNEVTCDDVEMAFIDLTEFWACCLEYIFEKVYGDLDYGEGWSGATNKDQNALKWLYKNGAITAKRSTTTIHEYIKAVAALFDVSEEMARKHYRRHQERGWVESKQVGKHSSKVWLTFTPQGVQGDKGGHLFHWKDEPKYFQISKKLVTTLDTLTTQKTFESEYTDLGFEKEEPL